jgi:hypothetical protein
MKNLSSSPFSLKATILSLLATIFFVIGPSDATAQQSTIIDNTYAVPQGNFVNVGEAIVRLNAALENLKISMAALDPHSDAYKTLEMRYLYFDNIRAILEEGKGTDSATVANAIASAIRVLSSDANNSLGVRNIYPFKQDAINLLSQ